MTPDAVGGRRSLPVDGWYWLWPHRHHHPSNSATTAALQPGDADAGGRRARCPVSPVAYDGGASGLQKRWRLVAPRIGRRAKHCYNGGCLHKHSLLPSLQPAMQINIFLFLLARKITNLKHIPAIGLYDDRLLSSIEKLHYLKFELSKTMGVK